MQALHAMAALQIDEESELKTRTAPTRASSYNDRPST
jgi:hypothetical protein